MEDKGQGHRTHEHPISRRGRWRARIPAGRALSRTSAIRAGSQKRSGAVLTASSQRTTEFTMMSEEKRCSCGTMR